MVTKNLQLVPSTVASEVQPQALTHNDPALSHEDWQVRDTFRYGMATADDIVMDGGKDGQAVELKSYLEKYEQNKSTLRSEMEARVFGSHVKVRDALLEREWKQKQLGQTRMPALAHSLAVASPCSTSGGHLGGSNVGQDILNGTFDDFSHDFGSVFSSGAAGASFDQLINVHSSAEVHRLGWNRAA
ncbi:hypothetical protein MIR68_007388 [Amoeboaphelidium protococcarum]|nr:hypothetical protein MIR68_007388 [Amoeboaphelidium protococcarum]